MEQEVETALVGILFLLKLLSSVLLIAQEQLDVAFAQIPRVVEHRLVVVYLLVRHRFAISLEVISIGNFQVSRFLIAFPLHDARSKVVVVEGEV